MIALLVLLISSLVEGHANRDVPSHLRKRFLSDVYRDKQRIADRRHEQRARADVGSNYTLPNATFTVTPTLIGAAAVVTMSWTGITSPDVRQLELFAGAR
jgi:hypothetical protein